MSLFGSPKDQPKRWSEYSLDFKLVFAIQIALMGLWIASSTNRFSLREEFAIYGALLACAAAISAWARVKSGWQWPGIGPLNLLKALAAVVFGGLFQFASTPLFPPFDPQALPWYLAGVNIVIFGVLAALNLVKRSRDDAKDESAQFSREPSWKPIIRATIAIGFVIVWLSFVGFIYFFGTAYTNGSSHPTALQTVPLDNHGAVRYVTPAEKARFEPLERISMVGIQAILVTVLILDVLLKQNLMIRARRDD